MSKYQIEEGKMSKNGNKYESIGHLNVSGRGEVQAKPDVATIMLAVITEAQKAEEAASRNAELAQGVIKQMRALGIPERDIQTSGLRLSPVYKYDDDSNYRRIVGYRAENSVSVKAPIELAGEVFDSGIEAGANEASGMIFGLRDERPYREAALEAAVNAAHQEARVVSDAMGLSLLPPREVMVEREGGPIIFQADIRTEKALATTPVMPGTLTIAAEVRITYQYRC
jgi:hypothetical protein